MSKPEYTPTPKQIREACREIQRTWGKDAERHRRTGSTVPTAYEVQ